MLWKINTNHHAAPRQPNANKNENEIEQIEQNKIRVQKKTTTATGLPSRPTHTQHNTIWMNAFCIDPFEEQCDADASAGHREWSTVGQMQLHILLFWGWCDALKRPIKFHHHFSHTTTTMHKFVSAKCSRCVYFKARETCVFQAASPGRCHLSLSLRFCSETT